MIQKKLAFLATVFALGSSLSFSSCDTCTTCAYTYDFGGADTTITLPEVCGNKAIIEEFKDQTAATAVLVNGRVSCLDN